MLAYKIRVNLLCILFKRELIEEPHGQNEMKYIKKKLDFNQKRCACDCTEENDQHFQFDFKNENETISNDN